VALCFSELQHLRVRGFPTLRGPQECACWTAEYFRRTFLDQSLNQLLVQWAFAYVATIEKRRNGVFPIAKMGQQKNGRLVTCASPQPAPIYPVRVHELENVTG
jgi:hypothetical protein